MRLPRLRFTARMMITFALIAGASLAADGGGPYFPDAAFFPKDKDLDSIVSDHLSAQLKVLREPSLWKLSRTDRGATAYRILWLATNEHPVCVRVSKAGGAITLRVSRHDGSPGRVTKRDKVTVDRTVTLDAAQWRRLVRPLEGSRFWTAPAEVKESRGVADGDVIVIEGVKGGQYHVIDRAGSTTGEAYKAFCRALLDHSGEDVLKVWDRFRQSERQSPAYLPEPKETEDRGDPRTESPGL